MFGCSATQASSINIHELKPKVKKEILEETRELRASLDRQLTSHVGTRYYRAPELILCEKDYGKPVDIWASGVIFGELLSMLE